jgi:hypothetical protein
MYELTDVQHQQNRSRECGRCDAGRLVRQRMVVGVLDMQSERYGCLHDVGERRMECDANENKIWDQRNREQSGVDKCVDDNCGGYSEGACAKEQCFPAWEKNNEIESGYQSSKQCCAERLIANEMLATGTSTVNLLLNF